MFRQRWIMIGFTLVLALVLTACAPLPAGSDAAPDAADDETVTLEWWSVVGDGVSEENHRELVRLFEEAHPNTKISLTILPPDGYDEKMTATLGAGEGAPDVAYFWDNNWHDQALDLTEIIAQDDEIDPSMFFAGNWNTRAVRGDRVIGLPLGVGANFVMYNKDVFDEMGVEYPNPDWTTDDYIELIGQLNSPDLKRWGGDRPRGAYRAIWMNHGALPYSADSTTVEGYLNSPESVAAYTWLWDVVNSGATPTPADIEVLGTEGTGPVDLFLAGRMAMATLNQAHMLNAIEAGANFGVVPEPSVPGNPKHVHGWSLTGSVWEGTEHPDEAWEFLKFWMGPEGQRYLMENGQIFPSIPEVLQDYAYADEEYVQAFFDILDLDQTAAWLGTHLCFRAAVLRTSPSDVWDRIMLGQIERDEIQAALDEAVPAAQAALDECRERLGS